MTTSQDYLDAFERERLNEYPPVDAFEKQQGYALSRSKLEAAASVLACPVKVNPPNWQHGRVIYAAARRYLSKHPIERDVNMLDIGTAKGFSALCAKWALDDSDKVGSVTSLDVIDPLSVEPRNSIADLSGPKTLQQYLHSWPTAFDISFLRLQSLVWLQKNKQRVHFAFVDGKHKESVVREEVNEVARVQEHGDVMILDDIQIPGVRAAVITMKGYKTEFVMLNTTRSYAVAERVKR